MAKTVYDQSGRFAIYNRGGYVHPFLLHDSQTGVRQSFKTLQEAAAAAEQWKLETPSIKKKPKKSNPWLPRSLR